MCAICDYLGTLGRRSKSRGGRTRQFVCPIHDDTGPSFTVWHAAGDDHWKCFGCLDAEELIWTTAGLKAIGKVAGGDEVMDAYGLPKRVSHVGHKQGAVLGLSTGAFRHDPLWLTPDHTCFFVTREEASRALPYVYEGTDRGARFKGSHHRFAAKPVVATVAEAAKIKVGDYLLFPIIPEALREARFFFQPEALAYPDRRSPAPRVYGLPVNEDTAWLYGLWLADGSTARGSVFFNRSDPKRPLVPRLREVLARYFSCSSIFEQPARHTITVICSKTDLARQLEYWFGKLADGKHLPFSALRWPVSIQRALLAGYRDGDGRKWGSAAGATKTVSRQLAYGMFALAIQAGELPTLTRQDGYVSPDGVTHKEARTIYPKRREGLNGFRENVDGTLYYWSRVSAIAHDPAPRPVVDITVERSHSFVTKLGAVHNCGSNGDLVGLIR